MDPYIRFLKGPAPGFPSFANKPRKSKSWRDNNIFKVDHPSLLEPFHELTRVRPTRDHDA